MIISFPQFQIPMPKFRSCTDHITATTHWKGFVTWNFETKLLFLSCDLARCWKTLDKIMWPLSLSIYIRLIELSLRSTNCLFSSQRDFFLPRPLSYFLCFILNSLRPRLSKKLVSPLSTISSTKAKHCSDFSRQKDSHPLKLSSVDIIYTKKLLQIDKAENAVQAAKVLSNIVTTFFSPQTSRRGPKKSEWRAVIKGKQPLLKFCYKKTKLVFAERYKEWTVEDWKRVWFSDKT